MKSLDQTIGEIVKQFPEDEWLKRCHQALPDVDDGVILSTIEILNGGDVFVLNENDCPNSFFNIGVNSSAEK